MTTCEEKMQNLVQGLKDGRGRGPVNPDGLDVMACLGMRHSIKAEEKAYARWSKRNSTIRLMEYSRRRDEYREYRRNDMRFALKLDAIRAAA